jgi:L-rhamnose mutarotase
MTNTDQTKIENHFAAISAVSCPDTRKKMSSLAEHLHDQQWYDAQEAAINPNPLQKTGE